MKALPYGLSDFPRIRCEDYYYVDKTRFIEMLERQPPYLFLIRPRDSVSHCFWPCWRRTTALTMPVDLKSCLENYISGNIRQSDITATWFCASTSLKSVLSWNLWSVRSVSIAAW